MQTAKPAKDSLRRRVSARVSTLFGGSNTKSDGGSGSLDQVIMDCVDALVAMVRLIPLLLYNVQAYEGSAVIIGDNMTDDQWAELVQYQWFLLQQHALPSPSLQTVQRRVATAAIESTT
jgi:hypothetical protein